MSNVRYQIRKIDDDNEISIILNNSIGTVLELDFDEASKVCQLMNKGAIGKLRYELTVVHTRDKLSSNE
jgi:hypothetical protein